MKELTGIPIDVFIAVCAGLGGLVYRDLIRRFKSYHKINSEQIAQLIADGQRRARIQNHMQSYVKMICGKLKIAYKDPPPDNERQYGRRFDDDDNGE